MSLTGVSWQSRARESELEGEVSELRERVLALGQRSEEARRREQVSPRY